MAKPGGIAYVRMHADVEVFSLGVELPEGFEEDPQQYASRHITTDQFIDAMLEHKMFQNPVNFGHADALRTAIQMRKNEKLDYYGAPRAALSVLASAINAPMFSIVTGGQPAFEPIYPWVPRVCQLLRPMMAMTKTILSSKPEVVPAPAPVVAPAPAAPEPTAVPEPIKLDEKVGPECFGGSDY